MYNHIKKNEEGAVALLAAILVASIIISIALSVVLVNMNNRNAYQSFTDSVQTFYSAETGVRESLMQLRKRPSYLIFDYITVGGVGISSEFVEIDCGEENCGSNIQAIASTTRATRKVRYTCDQDISDCTWSELIP